MQNFNIKQVGLSLSEDGVSQHKALIEANISAKLYLYSRTRVILMHLRMKREFDWILSLICDSITCNVLLQI